MSPKQRITRSSSKKWFGGGPCAFNFTEPPTYRKVIQHFYHIKASTECKKDYVSTILEDLKKIWNKVNSQLPLITDKSLKNKIQRLTTHVQDINNMKCKAASKKHLESHLDKLFDISACECELPILPCKHFLVKCTKKNCSEEHIACTCEKTKKVPAIDRVYLKDQRNKIGNKGSYQMSGVQKLSMKRQTKEPQETQETSVLPLDLSFTDDSDDANWNENGQSSSVYSNQLKFNRVAMEAVRYGISSRVTAALCNACILDLNDFSTLPFNMEHAFLDKSKIDRAKNKIKIVTSLPTEEDTNLACIGVDSKVNEETLTIEEEIVDGQSVLRKHKGPEHHLVFTKEVGHLSGTYLTHKTMPLSGGTGKVMAEISYGVLTEYSSLDSITGILVDNTSSNTGNKNGMVAQLEILLERRLHLIGCSLHQNELPFRALFKYIDGCTSGPTSFTGDIGKQCGHEIHLDPVVKFKTIKSERFQALHKGMPCCDDLSSDQILFWHYCEGIVTGNLADPWSKWKIGPMNHSRWLTLAIRILALYVRTHNPSSQLQILTRYIVNIYAPNWFRIKFSGLLKDMPSILFETLIALRNFNADTQEIIKKNIQGNAFCLLPENFLYCLICSEKKDERTKGWNAVLSSRLEPSSTVKKTIPAINWEAESWTEMIGIEELKYEPPATFSLSTRSIKSLSKSGGTSNIVQLPCHSQSVERCIKEVSRASSLVYGEERRHQVVKCTAIARSLRPNFKSKGDFTQSYGNYLTK